MIQSGRTCGSIAGPRPPGTAARHHWRCSALPPLRAAAPAIGSRTRDVRIRAPLPAAALDTGNTQDRSVRELF